MQITERQKEILNKIVGTYIESAEPVSSEFLEKKYKFSVCPATIRIEMQKLAENGFIFSPILRPAECRRTKVTVCSLTTCSRRSF